MNDDSDLIEEYSDYSYTPLRNSNLNDENRTLLKELNKLRYRFDNCYISEEVFFKKINNSVFFDFLTDFEWGELQKRDSEKKRLQKLNEEKYKSNYKLKKEQEKEMKQVYFILSLLIISILILIGLIS